MVDSNCPPSNPRGNVPKGLRPTKYKIKNGLKYKFDFLKTET